MRTMKKTVAILMTSLAAVADGQEQDVVLTASRGRPVPDLTQREFSVKVDSKPVPLDYFARVEEGTIHAPDLASAPPERVLAEYRKGGEAYVPRHFLIYMDVGHMSPPNRSRALEALRDL